MEKFLALLILSLIPAAPASARADKSPSEFMREVGFDAKPGRSIPMGLTFADETGRPVRLGDLTRGRPAILADVCEALIGAVFVDGGYPAASALIERLWGARMRTPVRPLRDSKTVLQEWAQARGLPTPAYREV